MEERLKAVCSGYYGFNNFGDEAVLRVLVQLFSKKYDLTIFSANPEETSKLYSVRSLYSFDYINVFKTICATDVFISGGGSLLQDVTSFKSLLYYLLLIYVANFYKKDVIIFAQGIGPLKSLLSRLLVKFALKHAKIVTVRDDDSLKLLSSWGIPAKKVCDPVYNLECTNLDTNGKLGIQLRAFQGLSNSFLQELASAVNTYFADKDVILYSLQNSLDLEVCTEFSRLLRVKSVEIRPQDSIDETIRELSSLEFLIAMRFHAALIGLKSDVKVLPIVYDKKVRLLAEEAGVPYVELGDSGFIEKVKNLKYLDTVSIAEKFRGQYLDEKLFDI